MTFAKDLVYRTWTKIEQGPHKNQKINANRTWIEITTPFTSYCLWLVGESKCRWAKQATLRFTNINSYTLFASFPPSQPRHRRQNGLSHQPKHRCCNHATILIETRWPPKSRSKHLCSKWTVSIQPWPHLHNLTTSCSAIHVRTPCLQKHVRWVEILIITIF